MTPDGLHLLTCPRCDDDRADWPEHLACDTCAEGTARRARARHRATGRRRDLIAAQEATYRSWRRSAASARRTAVTPHLATGDAQQRAAGQRIITRALERAARLDAAADMIAAHLPPDVRTADTRAAARITRATPLTADEARSIVAQRGPGIADHLAPQVADQ